MSYILHSPPVTRQSSKKVSTTSEHVSVVGRESGLASVSESKEGAVELHPCSAGSSGRDNNTEEKLGFGVMVGEFGAELDTLASLGQIEGSEIGLAFQSVEIFKRKFLDLLGEPVRRTDRIRESATALETARDRFIEVCTGTIDNQAMSDKRSLIGWKNNVLKEVDVALASAYSKNIVHGGEVSINATPYNDDGSIVKSSAGQGYCNFRGQHNVDGGIVPEMKMSLKAAICSEKRPQDDDGRSTVESVSSRGSRVSSMSSVSKRSLRLSLAKLRAEERAKEKRRALDQIKTKLQDEEEKEFDRQRLIELQQKAKLKQKEERRREIRYLEEDLEIEIRRIEIEEMDKELRAMDHDEGKIVPGEGGGLRRTAAKQELNRGADVLGNPNWIHNTEVVEERTKPIRVESPFGGVETNSQNFMGTLVDLSKGMLEVARNGKLPQNQLSIFSGRDIDEYVPFKLGFEECISANCSDDRQRYQLLLAHTSGEAKQLVSSCFQPDSSVALRQAIESLDDMYGDKFKLAQYFITRLKMWPPVRNSGDVSELQALHIFMRRIHNMRAGSRDLDQLDQYNELAAVVEKLPSYMAISWRKKVSGKHSEGTRANFEDLMRFVGDQVKELSLPFFGQNKRKSETIGEQKISFSTQVAPETLREDLTGRREVNAEYISSQRNNGNSCGYCEKSGHSIPDCRKFIRLSHEEKISCLSARRLCFRCCRIGHLSRNCISTVKCDVCNSTRHYSALHRRSVKGNEDDIDGIQRAGNNERDDIKDLSRVFASSKGESRRVFSPAVAVKVRWGGGEWINTYAALDAWADCSFISEQLSNKLGVEGQAGVISLTTMNGRNTIAAPVVSGVEVAPLDGSFSHSLGSLHQMGKWPFGSDDSPDSIDIQAYSHLRALPITFVNVEIGLLLGSNEPELLQVQRSVSGPVGSPFASLYSLGWALCGPSDSLDNKSKKSFVVKGINVIECLVELYKQEFLDAEAEVLAPSVEDKLWLRRVEGGLYRREDGKFVIPLPLRDNEVYMPDNKFQALACLGKLGRKLKSNSKLRGDYVGFVQDMIDKRHLELVPEGELKTKYGKVWYLVHHSVYHRLKNKIRVVFDCSRKSGGVSLNDKLLPGPDLMNKLVGVLIRFREGKVAFCGDIEQMFLQLKVPKEHTDLMRIFWWLGGDLDSKPAEYRLTSHTFGAVSSPSVANYAVKRVCIETVLSQSAEDTLKRSAYMDDIMRSVSSNDEATKLLKEVKESLALVGFNLVGILSNSRAVMEDVPRDSWNKSCREMDLNCDGLPSDRVLGVLWDAALDSFSFRLKIPTKPFTKRGMLSIVGGVFDPLGFVSPVIIPARSLFQQTCRRKMDWDEQLPRDLLELWLSWLKDIERLGGFQILRCIGEDMIDISARELHVFCDGSETAYAAVAYCRSIALDGKVVCNLVMSKTRQVPLSGGALTTVPRIELNAAKLGVSLMLLITRESNVVFDRMYFWSDSLTVLCYVRSQSTRFQRFVENRINFIVEHTDRDCWHYVPGSINIADVASRGVNVSKFLVKREWITGPEFLHSSSFQYFEEPQTVDNRVKEEIRKRVFNSRIQESGKTFGRLLESSNWWPVIIFRVAVYLSVLGGLRCGIWEKIPFQAEILSRAGLQVWKYVQVSCFRDEVEILKNGKDIKGKSKLSKLAPILDAGGVLRVGGRLSYAGLDYGEKHPIILLGTDRVTQAYVRYLHASNGHFGRNYLLAIVQESFHIIGIGRVIKGIVSCCVQCRKLNGRVETPFMAALPKCRVEPSIKPFHTTGIDFFGPFELSVGRRRQKYYGIVFTCLGSRAVHLEMADSLTTSSFINGFRRFQARRGKVFVVYSDNGKNLVGGCREMKDSMEKWDRDSLQFEAASEGFSWVFQPPKASHFGGIFEREIRTVRKVLLTVVREQGYRLTPEGLLTAFCEVESIMNNRPLTPVVAESVESGPITPNHLLLVRDPVPSKLEEFDSSENYGRKRWRYVQYLVDTFWIRWRKEYRHLLRERQKWTAPSRNLEKGDLVMLTDGDTPRNRWPTALVVKVIPSGDGVVRKVEIRVAKGNGGSANKAVSGCTVLIRPVHKLVLILRKGQLEDGE